MRRAITLLSAITVAAMGWTLGTAQAAPTPPPPPRSVHETSFSAEQQRSALRFWTAERLRGARDMTTQRQTGATETRSSVAAAGPRVTVPPVSAPPKSVPTSGEASPSAAASSPTPWTGGGLISTTAGKVFFQNASGGTFACSATVANADNKSVVLTAGHCVVDAGTGEVYRNWVFIPGYANGNRPFGTFTARSLFHLGQYVSTGGNANWDLAFAVMGQVNGRSLVDTVGAQGIAFNSPTGRHVHSFGYGGSAAEGNGERLNHCEGDEYPDAGRPGSTMWGIDCVQTGGSSGGGFLADFDTSNGGGYLIGNISVSAGNNEYHPTLGNEALDLYRQAGAA
ncbi:trypsin-like serine peptidase [Streptomyces milbemycinicus]|uniref:trypsin-like serine peptidase n=1 Tax=Streptomyces milbemycinicus TaxID=476552 RepID=UPI0033F4D145